MGEARAHHFISQCYLKGFTRNGAKKSRLCVVSLAECKTFESKPDGVAHIRDFNRVEGLPAGEVERMLAGFEGQIAAALKRISTDRSLDNLDAWTQVLYLVALFVVRHPTRRVQTQLAFEHTARFVLNLVTASSESWEAYQREAKEKGRIGSDVNLTFSQARELADAYNVDVPTARHIDLELQMLEPILQTLTSRQWTLYIAGPGAGKFVSSDRPVALAHSDGATESLRRPLAHGMTGTSLYFPINRELCAVGRFEGVSGIRQLDAEGVALFNAVTYRNAHRELYCADWKDSLMHDGRMVCAADVLALITATAANSERGDFNARETVR